MNKPSNYENTRVGGDYTPIEVGGHHAVIKSVKEQKSSTGKDMVVVAIDFAKNDEQPEYFKQQFDKDERSDKKWPYQAVQYILTEDAEGKCSRSFKSFITAFENSNNCEAVWGDKFCQQFKNKKIGVVYGEVEEEYNGEVKMRRRIRWFGDDKDISNATIPNPKYITNNTASKPVANSDSFMNIPEGEEEEVPF